MRFAGEAIFLIILCCIAFLAWFAANQIVKPRGKQWEVKRVEKAHDSCTEFWVVKGDQTELVGRAYRHRDDYTDKLMELQEIAEEKTYDWNSADKVLKS